MSMLDADVEPTSHEQVLFVVPEHCRSINSSYMLPLQSIYNGLPPEVSSCAYQPMLESTDYEVQCKLDDLYLNTFLDLSSSNNNFSSSESSHTSNITPENASVYCGDGCEENNSRADRLIDHLAAFVHPLYFLRCYEKTLGKTLTEEEWNQAKNILASQAIIACVETVRRKSTTLSGSATSVNTVTPHALVRLEMSENIRPGACLLPLNLRKGMCLDDYDEVRMYLVTRRLGAAVLPETIVLNPLQWNVSAETSVLSIQSAPPSTVLRLGESSLSNGDEVDSNVKMAFERFVQQNSWPKRPFILHDKQVVTLQIVDHCTTGSLKSATCTNTDYVVNISTGAKKK